jgi:hypothetical protein
MENNKDNDKEIRKIRKDIKREEKQENEKKIKGIVENFDRINSRDYDRARFYVFSRVPQATEMMAKIRFHPETFFGNLSSDVFYDYRRNELPFEIFKLALTFLYTLSHFCYFRVTEKPSIYSAVTKYNLLIIVSRLGDEYLDFFLTFNIREEFDEENRKYILTLPEHKKTRIPIVTKHDNMPESERMLKILESKEKLDKELKKQSFKRHQGEEIDRKYVSVKALIDGNIAKFKENLPNYDVNIMLSCLIISIEKDLVIDYNDILIFLCKNIFNFYGRHLICTENFLNTTFDIIINSYGNNVNLFSLCVEYFYKKPFEIEHLLYIGISPHISKTFRPSISIIESIIRSRILCLFKILYHKYIYLDVQTIFDLVQVLIFEEIYISLNK